MKINNDSLLFHTVPQIMTQQSQLNSAKEDADYFPWNEPAATVDISKEGKDKLFADDYRNNYLSLEDREKIENTGISAERDIDEETSSKKWSIAIRTFDELKRCVKENESLSDYEQENLRMQLEDDIYKEYELYKNKKLDPENDDEDKKLLDKELANDRMFRLRTLHDLEEAMEKEKQASKEKEQAAGTARDVAEIAEYAGDVKVISESLKYKDEEESSTGESREKAESDELTGVKKENMLDESESDALNGIAADTVIEPEKSYKSEKSNKSASVSTDAIHMWKTTLRRNEKNTDNMEELHDRRNQAVNNEKQSADLLDITYQKTMDYFRSGEATLKEQVELSEQFSEDAKILMQNREVNRFSKSLYNETIMDIRIKRIADHSMPDALKQLAESLQTDTDHIMQNTGQSMVNQSAGDALNQLRESAQVNTETKYEFRKVDEEEEKQKIKASRYDAAGKDKLDFNNSPYVQSPKKEATDEDDKI